MKNLLLALMVCVLSCACSTVSKVMPKDARLAKALTDRQLQSEVSTHDKATALGDRLGTRIRFLYGLSELPCGTPGAVPLLRPHWCMYFDEMKPKLLAVEGAYDKGLELWGLAGADDETARQEFLLTALKCYRSFGVIRKGLDKAKSRPGGTTLVPTSTKQAGDAGSLGDGVNATFDPGGG